MSMAAGLLINFKDAARSIRCVESLLAQPLDWVVVWDNSGAGDASLDAVRRHFHADPKVVFLTQGNNLGFAAGINRGITHCRDVLHCQHVLIINNDAVLHPQGMEKLQAALSTPPAAQVVYPLINHGGKIGGAIHYQRLTGLQFEHPKAGCFSFPSGCCLLVDITKAPSPLLDEDFFMYGEDCALGWRLSTTPHAVRAVAEVLVDHEGSVSSVNGSEFYESRTAAAHLILTWKLARNPLELIVMIAIRLPLLLARASLRAGRSRSLTPLRGLWKGLLIALGHDPLRPPTA
jgi:GT2 family glycosyltransferase